MTTSMDFLLKEKAPKEIKDLKLGKRLRSTEKGGSSITEAESSSQVNIADTNTMNQKTRMVTMGDKQVTSTDKKSRVSPLSLTNFRLLPVHLDKFVLNLLNFVIFLACIYSVKKHKNITWHFRPLHLGAHSLWFIKWLIVGFLIFPVSYYIMKIVS